MVKGNWERRAELADIRRAEAKAKKASRSKPKTNGEGAVTKLLKHGSCNFSNCYVYLEETEKTKVCRRHFRAESCQQRKCRLFHPEVTIAHLRCVVMLESDDEKIEDETACCDPVPLIDVPQKDFQRIRFIAVDGRCVFDSLFQDVWGVYWEELEKRAVVKKASASSLGSIIEECCNHEEEDPKSGGEVPVEKFPETTGATIGSYAAKTGGGEDAGCPTSANRQIGRGFTLSLQHPSVFGRFLAYLDDCALGAVLNSGRTVYRACLRDELVRDRRREGLAVAAAEASRRKKDEKKKRLRAAGTKKLEKKDGFARGNAGGR